MTKHSKSNNLKSSQNMPQSTLQQAIAVVNQLINSQARTQSEWILRQILRERASSTQASTNLQK